MKKLLVLLTVLLCALITVGCFGGNPKRPDTDLEFWICDNVDNFDFSDYQPKFGLMGGREYYGTGYTPATDENGEQIDPEHCVVYTVTSYPDYSSKEQHITRIYITDPDVEVYGLTLNSSDHDINKTMEQNGFTIKSYKNYAKGKVSIRFTDEYISISVDVSNIWGIQF